MSVVAVIMATCAVVVSVYEARIQREYQSISVWPNLSVYYQRTYEDQGGGFAFLVGNTGLGPAVVHSFSVSVDGEPMSNWADVLDRMSDGGLDLVGAVYRHRGGTSDLAPGKTVLPGESVQAVSINDALLLDDGHLDIDRMEAEICYCSVYGECWISRFEDFRPEAVRACPDEVSSAVFIPLPHR